MYITSTGLLQGPRYIINFPTKRHWRGKSRLEDIETGLVDLVRVIEEHGITSVAIPPLGCGLGGLAWPMVKPRIEAALAPLNSVKIYLYAPACADAVRPTVIANNAPAMTPGRAALIGLMHRYLEGLLDIADLDGDIDMDVEGDRAMVSIVGEDLDPLVGKGGSVLDALQELTRLAITRETGDRSRMMLDIGGFRAARRDELTEIGTKAAKDAKSTREPVKLKPMTPFERKVVHDAVAAEGCASESEGEEPRRFVVVLPPNAD
jgi:spoIIIJ-associated protein